MKHPHSILVIFLLTIILIASSCNNKGKTTKLIKPTNESSYQQMIKERRKQFAHELLQTDSIINLHEQAQIKKLQYFPIDTTWIIDAGFKADTGAIFEMPTSSARKPKYRRVGWLKLQHNKDTFHLAVYKAMKLDSAYKNMVFVPFKDGNAPKITYGGGRYLDFDLLAGQQKVTVDFNEAYNPYCVYSYRYSCPVTPKENWVNIKIEAGVKNPIKIY